MSIGKKQLIALLADKMDLPEEKVGKQLDQLIKQIQAAASQGENFEIEDFGTFIQDEGELKFEPDPTLQTEINHKYIGMKPIELIGAFKEKASDAPPAGKEESGDDDESVEMEPQSTREREDEPGTEQKEEAPGLEEEMVPVESPAPPEVEITEEADVSSDEISQELNEESRETETNLIDRVLIVGVVVIVLGVSGWMLAEFGVFDKITGTDNNNSQTEVVTEQPPDESESEESENSEQNSEDDVSSSEEEVAESSRDDIYGLRGGATPEAPEPYTIVIHSLGDESKIRELEEQYESDGYLTLVQQATVGGETYWRLGLGQFESVEDAQQAAEELPEQLRNNHFIRKFQ